MVAARRSFREDRRRAPRPPNRARHARRVQRARRGVQHDGERARLEPTAALIARASIWSGRASKADARALSRDHPRAHRHRRRLLRRAGPRQRRQPGGPAAARARRRRARCAGRDGVRREDLRPLAELAGAPGPGRSGPAWRGGQAARRQRRGGGGAPARRRAQLVAADPRRPRAAPARRDDDPRRRRRRARSVLVVDDVTPLVQAQKVAACATWPVASRTRSEPADADPAVGRAPEAALRRTPEPTRRLVDRCARAIVAEVESLKSLVDEFSQFSAHAGAEGGADRSQRAARGCLALYAGLLTHRGSELTGRPICRPSARSRAGAAGRHQPRRQRHRGAD